MKIKKMLACLLTAGLTFCAVPALAAGQLGDVNGDGSLTSADARLALRLSVNLESWEPGSPEYTASDADCDGKVTSGDARLILRASVGLETLPSSVTEQCEAFSVELPGRWQGKYVCKTGKTYISFYQAASRKSGKNGLLFTLRLRGSETLPEGDTSCDLFRVRVGEKLYYAEILFPAEPAYDDRYEEAYWDMAGDAETIADTLLPLWEGAVTESFDFGDWQGTFTGTDGEGATYDLSFVSADRNTLYTELVCVSPDGDPSGVCIWFRMLEDVGLGQIGEDPVELRRTEDGFSLTLPPKKEGAIGADEPVGLTAKTYPDEPPQEKLSSREIYLLASAFTYEITAYTGDGSASTGTGFSINRDGWIVTNYHVIDGAQTIVAASLAGLYYNVTDIVACDQELDLAILKISHARAYALLNKTRYATGDQIYTLGSSKGLTGSFSNGVIAEKNRSLDGFSVTFIQLSAPISSGNSGGPLLNEYGEVIGVNSRTYLEGQNLNFAIPVRYLDELDTSQPVPMEEFAAQEESGGTSDYSEEGVWIPYDELELQPGGTAFIPVIAHVNHDFRLTWESDSAYVNAGWSDWLTWDTVILFLSVKDGADRVPVTVYVTQRPELSYTFTVTATAYGGDETYLCPSDVPDAGAVWGVPSSQWYVSQDTALKTAVYEKDALAATGKTAAQLMQAYGARLEAHGYALTDRAEVPEDGMAVATYRNGDTGVTVTVYEYFDKGRTDGPLQSVTVDFFDPMLAD